MIIEYERAEGDSRTLSIKFGANGQMVGAEVSGLAGLRQNGDGLV